MKHEIKITFRDFTEETHIGNMQLLSCGVMEITKETSETNTFIASVKQKEVTGIPLSNILKYVIKQIN